MGSLPLRRINTCLLLAIIAVNLFTICQPFWPQLYFAWQGHHSDRRQRLEKKLRPVSKSSPEPTYASNTLIMPALLGEQAIHEGPVRDQYKVLREGVWHYPTSSSPVEGGNTVLLAHRFTYTNPRGAFYFLDKLATGDRIGVYWQHKLYTYEVTSTQRLPATSTDILRNTAEARLTLFTCAPLWHPTDRLVVIAKQVDI